MNPKEELLWGLWVSGYWFEGFGLRIGACGGSGSGSVNYPAAGRNASCLV